RGNSLTIRVMGALGADLLLKNTAGCKICRSVGFLVTEALMVDAETLGSELTLDEQKQIKHILISHMHWDHIKGIPHLVDNLSGVIDHQIIVSGLDSVIDGLKKHVFNDLIFPNFFDFPGSSSSILQTQGLKVKKEKNLSDDIMITPILVNHTIETAGYLIRDDKAAWIYSGDTHLTEEIWQ